MSFRRRRRSYGRRSYGRRRSHFTRSRPELKFKDTNHGLAVVAVTGTVATSGSIVNMVQGTTASTRIGRKIVVHSVHVRSMLVIPADAATSGSTDVVRMILYVDKQANGVAAVPLTVLEGNVFDSYRNLDFTRRFRVLKDLTIVLNAQAAASTATPTVTTFESRKNVIFSVSGLNIPVFYDANVGDITDVQSNNIGMILWSEGALAFATVQFRIRFSE